ncbi:MAG: hypothetical protein AB4911_02135 [Oscillochloridaceae bacterium umkhey_bin13]
MSIATSSSAQRSFWPFVWLFLSLTLIPWLVTRVMAITFPELGPGWQLAIWVFAAFAALLLWARQYGGGVQSVDRESTLIVRDPTRGGAVVFAKGSHLLIPLLQHVEARLPNYAFRFEPEIKQIDTNTPMLGRIDLIRVRLDCRIKNGQHLRFFEKAASRVDLLRTLKEERKLDATDHRLWKEFIAGVIEELVDDAVRDVVWTWPDPTGNDPTSLSKKRLDLAIKVEERLEYELRAWGLELLPLSAPAPQSVVGNAPTHPERIVLETIQVNPEMVKGKLRNFDNMLKRAEEDARIQAVTIRERGYAEAEVRARALALLLDDLITKRGMKLDDPLLAQVVRAALYSDGEMIWKSISDQPNPDKK